MDNSQTNFAGSGLIQGLGQKAKTPIDDAQAVIEADKAHRSLACDQVLMLTVLRPHFQSSLNQLSESMFKWFQHMGFWPEAWNPRGITVPAMAGSAYCQAADGDHYLTREEFTRLKKAEKIALIHSEISEMLEAVRKGDTVNEAEEMADTFIRILDYCGGFDINLGAAFFDKMVKNYKRPFKHGKAF